MMVRARIKALVSRERRFSSERYSDTGKGHLWPNTVKLSS